MWSTDFIDNCSWQKESLNTNLRNRIWNFHNTSHLLFGWGASSQLGEITHRQGHGERQLLAPQCGSDRGGAMARRFGPGQCAFTIPGGQQCLQLGQPRQPPLQEGSMGPGAGQGVSPVAVHHAGACEGAAALSIGGPN